MRQNTYLVHFTRIGEPDLFDEETTIKDSLTVTIDVQDPGAIEEDIKCAISKYLKDLSLDGLFWLHNVSLLDMSQSQSGVHSGIVFSNDKSLWQEEKCYLIRSVINGSASFFVAYCKGGALFEQDSNLPLDLYSMAELQWSGFLS